MKAFGVISVLLVCIVGILYAAVLFIGKYTVVAAPGTEVVLYDRPYFFGSEGIRDEPLKQGRIRVWQTTAAYHVTVIPQTVQIVFDDLATTDGSLLDFKSNINYQITDPVKIVKSFGDDWFNVNIRNQYMLAVRDIVKSYTMKQIMTDQNVGRQIDQQVTDKLDQWIKDRGIPVKIIDVSLGQAIPNEDVRKQINQTTIEQQNKLTVKQRTEVEEARIEENKKKAEADNAYRLSMGLSPSEYVELRKAEMYSEACKVSKNCIVTTSNSGLLNSISTK